MYTSVTFESLVDFSFTYLFTTSRTQNGLSVPSLPHIELENLMNKRIAVLVSGTGSLLEAMIKAKLPIALVLADRDCRGVEIATQAGISTRLVRRKDYGFGSSAGFSRDVFTHVVLKLLLHKKIDIIAMAGFMTIFSPVIFNHFGGRILNSHPALLPAFKGDKAVHDALKFGVKVTGCTIHVATEVLDEGPILAQKAVPVLDEDTVDSLWERIKQAERPLYPRTIREFAKSLS